MFLESTINLGIVMLGLVLAAVATFDLLFIDWPIY